MKTFTKFFGLAISIFTVAFCTNADAQFSGYFAPGNWVTSNNSDGTAVWSGAPGSLIVNGGNDGSNSFGFIDLTIASNVTGTVSFNWSYNSVDASGSDEALFINNAVYFPLSNTSGSSGFVSFSINAGELIGYRLTLLR